MNTPGFRWQARLFRLLVRVSYPAWLRRAHGAEMEEWFLSHLARERGVRARLRLWRRVAADAASSVSATARRRRVETRPPASRAGRIDMLWQDVRYAVRHLTRTPLFAASGIALLAMGLGANIAVFALVDRLLVRPLPYNRPGDVVFIYQDSDEGEPSSSAFPAYRDIAATTGVFSAVAATSPGRVTMTRDGSRENATIEYTTASYIAVAGREPHIGRWLSPEADAVGGALEAVISEPAWRTKFNADPGVLGRSVRLNDQKVTIVGVGPAGLLGSYAPIPTDFWVSISSTPIDGPYRVANLNLREDHWYDIRARLADGVTAESAQHAMTALAAAMGEAHPVDRGRRLTLKRATDVRLYPETEGALLAATAVAALLLILGVANLANLLLVRAVARSGEMAVRRAMGANGTRIARLHVVEALLLTSTGAALGVMLARMALDALSLVPLPPAVTAAMALPIDSRIAVFAAGVALLCGLLLGLAPAWRSMRDDVIGGMRDDRRTSSASRMTMRLRSGLVTVQVAGSLVLLIAAGLLARSLAVMMEVDPGVDAGRVAYIDVTFGGEDGAPGAMLDEVLARVSSLPGVTHAAAASRLPAQRSGTTTTIVEGYTPPAGAGAVELGYTAVSPMYFDTVGLSVLEGRQFTWDDAGGRGPVVVVNRAAARQFWGAESAIGRRLRSQSRPDFVTTVIGVVEDAPVTTFPERVTPPMFYSPSGRAAPRGAYILARTEGDAEALVSTVAGAVSEMRSTFEIDGRGTLSSHLGEGLTLPRAMTRVMGIVSLIALTLAALGIYAVVAFNVARRTTELGIRIALGATAAQVTRMVLIETTSAVGLGLALGLALATLTVPQLASVLFGVEALDPAAFAGSAAVLAAAAWIAAYLPARRAAQTDPAIALRTT